MRPLSMDLRRRIVEAYGNGEGSHEEIGERFAVSRAVVGKLTLQFRRLGTLEPQTHLRGRKPAISGEKEQALRQHVEEHPDATLKERRDALELDCTVKTVWQTLRRLGLRYKKSRRGPPSRIDPMSRGGAKTGALARGPSTPIGWCSSTKPG